ncbi:MAG: hypothetical protein PHQ75_09485 [Thermoguttaceae bacterium]|nr:hypothetical protein [Thermoguttaceae bacterium]
MTDRTAADKWTDDQIIKVGPYWCRTSFEDFWKLLETGEPVVYCQFRVPRFFSKDKEGFCKYRSGAVRKFVEKQIAFIDPALYNRLSQEIPDFQIAALIHPEWFSYQELFSFLHPEDHEKIIETRS